MHTKSLVQSFNFKTSSKVFISSCPDLLSNRSTTIVDVHRSCLKSINSGISMFCPIQLFFFFFSIFSLMIPLLLSLINSSNLESTQQQLVDSRMVALDQLISEFSCISNQLLHCLLNNFFIYMNVIPHNSSSVLNNSVSHDLNYKDHVYYLSFKTTSKGLGVLRLLLSFKQTHRGIALALNEEQDHLSVVVLNTPSLFLIRCSIRFIRFPTPNGVGKH